MGGRWSRWDIAAAPSDKLADETEEGKSWERSLG
jgi:hypothetical protein